MKYRGHYANPIHGHFGIVIDDETLTWTSDPPGNDIPEPFATYFTHEGGGPIGSGKDFEVLPGGRARLVK